MSETFGDGPLSARWLAGFAVAGVVAVAAVTAIGALERRGQGQEVSNAWARYSRCLIGEVPLANGETLRSRLTRIDQAIGGDPTAIGWPSRCDPIGEEFTKAAQALADKGDRYETLAHYGALSFPLSDVKTGVLADLFDKVPAARLPTPSPGIFRSDPPVPPAPLETLVLDGTESVAYGDSFWANTEATPGAPVRLLWETIPRRYCFVEAPFEVARCRDLSPSIKGAAELAPMNDATFEPLIEIHREHTIDLVHGFSGALAGTRPFGAGVTIGDEVWFDDRVAGKTSIFVRPAADPKAKPTIRATLETSEDVSFRTCRMPDARAVVVAVAEKRVHAFFPTAQGWSPMVSTAWTSIRSQRLTCRAGEITLTGIKDQVVSQLRCTASGCTHAESASLPTNIYEEKQDLYGSAAVDLDGKVLLLGHTQHRSIVGDLGGMQLRLGAIADLASSRDVLMLGADDRDIGIWWNHVQVFVRGPQALLVLRGSNNRFHLVRLDASGAFARVRLERE